MPLGTFLIAHLVQQSRGMWAAAYSTDGDVPKLLGTGPTLGALVLLLLGTHAAIGLLVVAQEGLGLHRGKDRRQQGNALQRLTGLLVLAFLVLHVLDVIAPLATGELAGTDAYQAMAARLSGTQAGVPWWALGYVIGIGAIAYHAGSGLAHAARRWGCCKTARGRRWSVGLGALVGLATLVLGTNTTILLATGTAWEPPWAPAGRPPDGPNRTACPVPTAAAEPSGTQRPRSSSNPQ